MNLINIVSPTGSGFIWFLTKCILWLAETTSSIALAVILFTVILKLITLPADIYSKYSMRKNSMIMEKMRPELEKLQKQYAGDKTLYQQKMNALYKKNGYSMLGACLPSIITLVIFIIAIAGFNDFSKYQNRKYVYEMSLSYNQVIYDGFKENEYAFYDTSSNKWVLTDEFAEIVKNTKSDGDTNYIIEQGLYFSKSIVNDTTNVSVWTYDGTQGTGYAKCTVPFADGKFNYTMKTNLSFEIISGSLNGAILKGGNTNFEFDTFDDTKLKEIEENANKTKETLFVETVAAEASAYTFRQNVNSFLWVKNIWVADSAFAHPVDEKLTTIAGAEGCGSGCSCSSLDDEGWASSDISEGYKKLISRLDKEKEQPNGYFILVILTAGSSLILQLITSKSQKAQAELQTVDGKGAMSQKMMTWMMPIMMAVFAFTYTAAFSIYIVLSSAISIGTTLLINFILNRKFKKAEEGGPKEVVRGRVYTPKEQPKKEEKKVKKNKKEAIPDNDFLSGKADKKSRKK